MSHVWAEHRVFEAAEGAILFGVEEASLFYVDAATRELVQRLGSLPAVDLPQASIADREILAGLQQTRLLRPQGVIDRRAPSALPLREIPLGTLVLEVAQDCNLRCRYCYADGGAYGGAPRLLSPQMARRAARLLIEEAGDRETVTLVLFGGEPLLNMPAVEAAVEEAVQRARQAGIQVHISLTTNGTLLTSEIIDFLRRYQVGVSISLDGPPDLHDANRPDTAGKGSYARILANLPELLTSSPAPVGARVTLTPEQWGRIGEVFDHLCALGFHEVGIAPASPITSALFPDADQEALLLQEFGHLARRFREAVARGRILPFSNLLDLLGRLHLGQTKEIACGAGFGYLALDAAGNFFPCHRLAGEASFRVGNLDDGPDPDAIQTSLDRLTTGKAELCSDCWARALCRGGCHYENHLRENRLGLPPGTSCNFIRSWLQLGIELYADLCRSGADHLFERLEKRTAG